MTMEDLVKSFSVRELDMNDRFVRTFVNKIQTEI